jgi:hypothetical protein
MRKVHAFPWEQGQEQEQAWSGCQPILLASLTSPINPIHLASIMVRWHKRDLRGDF